MSETIIYTITTIEHPTKKYRENGSSYVYRDMRTIGFALSLEDATEWVTDNTMDMNEAGNYPYVVVEAFAQGIYPMCREEYKEHWFKWDKDAYEYVSCEKPEEYSNTIGFGIG